MGLLRQDAALHQRLAERARRTRRLLDHHADHQPASTHLSDVRRVDGSELVHEPVAKLGRPLREPLVDKYTKGGAADSGGQRVAAEGGPVVPRHEHVHHLFICQDHGDRIDAATQGFPEHHDIGPHTFPFTGQHSPRPTEARLNLIGHQLDVRLATDGRRLAQVAIRRNDHPTLTLNRLHQEANCVLVDRRA